MSVAHLDWAQPEREAFGRIQSAIASIREAENVLAESREGLQKQIAADLPSAPVLAAPLYWEHGIGITILAATLGATQAAVRSLIGTETVETTCSCGDVFLVHCTRHEQVGNAHRGRIRCLACEPHGRYGAPERSPGRRDLDRLAELRAMEYGDYLETDEWDETRRQALARARHSCEVCSGKYALQVHHRTYDRMGTEQPRDLIVLCRECHGIFHQFGRLRR